jgi:hypothetical protein
MSPDVGSAGDQGPSGAARAHAQLHCLLRNGAPEWRQLSLNHRTQVQCGDLRARVLNRLLRQRSRDRRMVVALDNAGDNHACAP